MKVIGKVYPVKAEPKPVVAEASAVAEEKKEKPAPKKAATKKKTVKK